MYTYQHSPLSMAFVGSRLISSILEDHLDSIHMIALHIVYLSGQLNSSTLTRRLRGAASILDHDCNCSNLDYHEYLHGVSHSHLIVSTHGARSWKHSLYKLGVRDTSDQPRHPLYVRHNQHCPAMQCSRV